MGRLEITCRTCGTVTVPGRLVRFDYVELGSELQVDAPCSGCGRWTHVFVDPGLRDRLELIGARLGPPPEGALLTDQAIRELVARLDDERSLDELLAG